MTAIREDEVGQEAAKVAAAIAASNAACAHLDRHPSTDGPLGRARPLGEGFVSHEEQ
jgi:hypothetical protein